MDNVIIAHHQQTGLPVIAGTGLVPVVIQSSVPERGYRTGEARGLHPQDAAVCIRSGVARLNESVVPKKYLGFTPEPVAREGLTAEQALMARSPAGPAPAADAGDMK